MAQPRTMFLEGKDLSKISNDLSDRAKSYWKSKVEDAKKNSYRRRTQFIAEESRLRSGSLVLDVGCGIGSELADMAWLGANCVGIDFEEDFLKSVSHLRKEFSLTVAAVHGSADTLPFRDNSFDVVMSNHFFEHARDLDLALSEQVRVLKKAGRIIIRQANLLSPLTFVELLIVRCWSTKGHDGGFKWLFTKKTTIRHLYGTRWPGKEEDIHSKWWWIKKIRKCRDLHLERCASIAESATRWGKLARLLDDICIICSK